MPLIDDFFSLFQGNLWAYGTEDGGCARIGNPTDDPYGRMRDLIELHLTGDSSRCIAGEGMGVYPMVREVISVAGQGHLPGEWKVHWGCVDFDEGEELSWVHAKNVYLALRAYEVSAWIERSRSKGYHVWVFADDWVPATTMRDALLAACQCVDAPTKEINPKQYALKDGQLGNYVRLPYPGWLGDAYDLQRRVVLDPEDRMRILLLSEFARKALEARTPIGSLERLAEAYEPPERPIRRREWDAARYDTDARRRLRGMALLVYWKGPLDGSGRGHTLYKLACHLREDGMHTKAEALQLVTEADADWGKFSTRKDGEQRLAELVDKAWESTTPNPH